MDEHRGIGLDNRLPWHLPDDLKRFKRLTMGHHLIMGRKTFESIGRPLPGRETIILSRQRDLMYAGCTVVSSLQAALELAESRGEDQVFIAGGGQLYAQALQLADCMHLTHVYTIAPADTFFPEFDRQAWLEKHSIGQDADRDHAFAATYRYLVREMDA